jgi:hypothetical protein
MLCVFISILRTKSQEKTMVSRKTIGGSLAALVGAGAMLLAATTAQAAMSPSPAARYSTPDIQLAWCAAGFHVGPLGACIGGGPGWRGPGWRGPGWGGHRCWINRWGNRVCRW